jgi:hypothetical protein
MTYDSQAHYILVVEGGLPSGCSGTWSYASGNWTNRTLYSPGPSGLFGSVLADDKSDHYVLLFSESYGKATWTYSRATWSKIIGNSPPSKSPAARDWESMAYDTRVNSTILFGGVQPSYGYGCAT